MVPEHIIFVANSPGEISGWLAPLVKEARRRWPKCRLILQMLTCEFATGAEGRVARDMLGVDEVITPAHYPAMLLCRAQRFPNAIIIHLGGDMFYSAMLAKRYHLPLWIYVWGRRYLDSAFSGYFVRQEQDAERLRKKGIPEQKIHIVGDLVADATAAGLQRQSHHLAAQKRAQSRAAKKNGEDKNLPLISFLPGSREHEVSGLSPFYLEVASLLQKQAGPCRFQLIVSPYIEQDDLRRLLTALPLKKMGGCRARFDGEYMWAPDNTRLRVVHSDHLAHLSKSALALTIPGTKTSELACLGVPMLSILPLNRPDLLPLTGILGLLDFLPGGQYVKGKLMFSFVKRPRFFALPNMQAQREILPELVGVLNAEQVASRLASLLSDKDALQQQAQALRQLYAPHLGAASRIFDCLGEYTP